MDYFLSQLHSNPECRAGANLSSASVLSAWVATVGDSLDG